MGSTIGVKNSFGQTKRIIVGIIDGAIVPELDIAVEATMPKKHHHFFKINGGRPFPSEYVQYAKNELDNLVNKLITFNVLVDRPSVVDFSKPIVTPDWKTLGGLYAAMPRDILLVLDSKIVVAPMSWRCRYDEIKSYNDLLIQYAQMGYEIIYPIKPELKDTLYNKANINTKGFNSILNETEAVFDAADFIVIDKTILVQKSHVTNQAGIDWLKMEIGDEYEIHLVETGDDKPMHIDATIVPLREGVMLINPDRVNINKLRYILPIQFKNWDFVTAPQPIVSPKDPPKYMSSNWLSINIITLDSKTVFIEESQYTLGELLQSYNFDVVPIPFKYFQCFGGSFHCATQEIIRE